MGGGQGGNEEGRRDCEGHQAGLQGEWTNSGRIDPRAAQMRCVVESGIAAAVFYYAVHDYLPWRASGTRSEATTRHRAWTAIAIPMRRCPFSDIRPDPSGIGALCNVLEIDLRYFIHGATRPRSNPVATVQEPICKVFGRLYILNVGMIIGITTTAA